ncbi:hypothetical protein [Gymnodinialimonas ulvae]|uniref:hypothetical protein n=1 Tax=Gymnodinialimonas ulvae TaxID=3126504 RepID=UPI00309D55C5
MPQFLAQNADMIGLAMDILMVVIWLTYLQLFFFTIRTQRRPSLHIDRGAAKDENARLTVTNMGREPIYLLAIVVDLGKDDGTSRAIVTDRSEIAHDDASAPMDRTNQGPLGQGKTRDIGSLNDIMNRAQRRLNVSVGLNSVRRMWVSAVAISHEGERIVAASKAFSVDHTDNGALQVTPDSVLTDQIRSPLRRRELLTWLEDRDEV